MSRRDTIIVAVLVNAALLMVLFATAVRSDHVESSAVSKPKKEAQLVEVTTPVKQTDDELLNQYIASVPTLAETAHEEILFPKKSEIECQAIPVEHASVEEVVSKQEDKQQFVNVTVKKGDFLEKIARANNTTVTAVMQANHMSSTQLKVGQVLKIPLSNDAKQPIVSPSSQEADYYIVKEGDNPWLIASRNKINLEELLRLNGLDDFKAKRLRPGDKLRIR